MEKKILEEIKNILLLQMRNTQTLTSELIEIRRILQNERKYRGD